MVYPENVDTSRTDLKKPEPLFYLAWISVTVLAVPITFLLIFIIMGMITAFVGDYVYVNGVRHITEDFLFIYIFVPLLSLITGLLQFVLLRKYLPRMGWWIFVTTGGWLLGMLLIALPGWFHWTDAFLKNMRLILTVMGFSIGVVQWLLLRRRLPKAGWWIAASLVGWGLLALFTPGQALNQYGLFTIGFFPACGTAAALRLLFSSKSLPKPSL